MDTQTIIVLALLEAAGIVMVVRLWWRKSRRSVMGRVLWSLVLLVPLFGPIFYGLVYSDPEPHPDFMEEFGGADEAGGSGGGGSGD